ncbi:MAG TPA: right-handed parallel beta-helix repeat-containing protein [Nitrososphaeraceae archaeon]|nr:right-handed parallel beta-helix repeat-containing protein [Nitrososphaeraceae archaeon]
MIILSNGFSVTAVAAVLIFFMAGIPLLAMYSTNEQEGTPCIEYDQPENSIVISCDYATFDDVIDTINDRAIIEYLGHGEFVMKANLRVNNGATFAINSDDELRYLKIAGANGIIVNGKIQIDGVKITSWDTATNDVIDQNMNGNISRGYIQFAASEGSEITNSEFAYLGYQDLGKRGFDLFGDGGASHDMEVRDNTFHHMWRAFYSKGAYNVTIDGNEFHHNINYGVDPHSGTHDIKITNNWIHDDPIGVICSLDCYHIVIEGNKIYNNTKAGIFFSRGMQDSIARNNHIYNSTSGIILAESANNQIYDNTIEASPSEGVLMFNPAEPDEGLTENNLVYNNTISDSPVGINATSSHSNILGNNTFSNITSSEYHLTRNSNIRIIEQDFDNTSITPGNDSETSNTVEIVYSGIIEVREVSDRKESGGNSVNHDIDESTYYYNTENRPYRKVMDDDDSITVNS